VRPRLLDLFCGAGGATKGYQNAGFHVTGVDIKAQPNYCGDEFVQMDVLEFLHPWQRHLDFDAAHASPPCQFATAYRRTGKVKPSPNLIEPTRRLLEGSGLPWVIENIEQARPFLREPVMVCGTMLEPPMEVQRHRLFEANWPLTPPTWPCRHKLNGPDRYPGGRSKQRTGFSRGLVRATVEIGSWDIPFPTQQRAMGMDWSTLEELSEAIPPAYTKFIGHQLLAQVREKAAA
jgi:DNA (cytosine-5)-methyltransferase 1